MMLFQVMGSKFKTSKIDFCDVITLELYCLAYKQCKKLTVDIPEVS